MTDGADEHATHVYGKTVRDARAPDDRAAPALGRMSEKRIRSYRSLGYAFEDGGGLGLRGRRIHIRQAEQRPGNSR